MHCLQSLGTATHWPEYLVYNLETDSEEKMQDIKNAAVPYNTVGLLEVSWTPLAGPNEEDEKKPIRDIDDEDALLGKPWTYRCVHVCVYVFVCRSRCVRMPECLLP